MSGDCLLGIYHKTSENAIYSRNMLQRTIYRLGHMRKTLILSPVAPLQMYKNRGRIYIWVAKCMRRIHRASCNVATGRPAGDLDAASGASHPSELMVPPLAQPIEASLAKPDLNAPTSVSISASAIGVENTHAPELMMLQPSL